MIEIEGLSKSFRDQSVLKDISITFERGQTNLIIGASGSGKTVLTKCIVGLYEIDAGQIMYDQRDFVRMSFSEKKRLRKEIGMLFQGGALFDSMSSLENIIFPLRMFTRMSEDEMRERALFCLNRVNLPDAGSLLPSELSGGMKKRVGIARAIALNPKYLICDEPNSGLDPQTANLIDLLIQEITREFDMTTIVVTHDMNSVMEIGDKVTFIFQGQKWWDGTKEEILATDNKEVVDFVYTAKFMKALRK